MRKRGAFVVGQINEPTSQDAHRGGGTGSLELVQHEWKLLRISKLFLSVAFSLFPYAISTTHDKIHQFRVWVDIVEIAFQWIE